MGPYFDIRPVYYMQKMNYYYSPLAFFLGTLIVDLPLCMFESTIFGTIVYWMSGLKATAQAFIFFLAVVFVLSFLILSMVRMTAFGVAIIEQAQGIIPLFIVLQLFFTGFLITYSTAWDGLSWIFWISPFNYGNQALVINELSGTTFRCTEKELVPPSSIVGFDLPFSKGGYGGQQICPTTTGEEFLLSLDFKTANVFKVYYFLVVLGMCAIFQVLAFMTMKFCYFPPPPPKGVGPMKDREEEDAEAKSKESTGKSEAYMAWRDVSYSVEVRKSMLSLKKKKLQLLYNIDGYVKPGMMLALMGPSGAGKSTLLDVLARRKTGGKATGDILINGKKLNDGAFAHIMGYVEQQNLHIETVTVKEAILFSAYLRLSEKLSKAEKIEHAKWVLKALELDVIEDTILFQLSFEQMKRVTIGVELAADPAILFLDEPTSGLDARAAALVMQCVKDIAMNSGKAVICTIHQPAEPVFRLFSDLLLLKRGGNTIYFGPIGENYSTLLEYFERNFGEKPELMRNPADFILDMCTVTTHDFAKVYDESPEHKQAIATIDKGIVPEGFQQPPKRDYYSASFLTQFKYLTHRSITFWWRQPQVVWGSMVINTFLGIFMGLLYYQLPNDPSGLVNRTALIYLGTLLPAMSTILFIALFIGERPTYTREQSSATYHPLFYVGGIFTAHIPLNVIAVLILTSGFYFLSGLRTEGSPQYFFFMILASIGNVVVFMAVHMVCAVSFPSIDIANGFASTIISLFGLFSGFMIRTASIPDWWIWFHYLSPQYYTIEAVFANEFQGVKYGCPNNEGAYFIPDPKSKTGEGKYYCPYSEGGSTIEALFDFHLDRQWKDIGILYSMGIFYLGLVVFAIRYIQHINR